MPNKGISYPLPAVGMAQAKTTPATGNGFEIISVAMAKLYDTQKLQPHLPDTKMT